MSELRLRDATVAIVGLGLMGGSLGLALAGAGARRLGADVGDGVAAAAVAAGVVDEVAPAAQVVADADIVVLAMPPRAVADALPELARHMRLGAVLTDVASIKGEICAAMDRVTNIATIGGHPMCGREQSGLDAADAQLFDGARWALCPTQSTSADARRLVGELVAATGACAVDVERDAHDRAVATASHLPYVLAQALVGALVTADADTEGVAGVLAATGFRGATRLAGGDVDMWRDILTGNADHVRSAVEAVRSELDALVAALDDAAQLERLLRTGRTAQASFRSGS